MKRIGTGSTFSRTSWVTLAALLFAAAGASQKQDTRISMEATWDPASDALEALRNSCRSLAPPAMKKCFANGMSKAGATAEAVRFTRTHGDVTFLRDLHSVGSVDIAAVSRPYRANDTEGILLLNGLSSEVDIDDLSRLPVRDMERESDYAALLKRPNRPLLLADDRNDPSVIEVETTETEGVGLIAAYRVADGCRACETLGHARYAFDFDKDGKFKGARFVGFSLVGADGEEDAGSAPAPLEMSAAPKLIQALYQATRERKEATVLELIAQARDLVARRSDVLAVGPQKRTALHWAVFGSAAATRPRTVAAYEELALALLEAGVDVNSEDQYQNTALDYLDHSPNEAMQKLLLERGAVSGYFTGDLRVRFVDMFQRVETVSQSGAVKARNELVADLVPGQTISVRLTTPVGSQRSWTGDPVEAVVTAPLMNGSQVLVAPGTKIEGTVYFAQAAPNKYSTPRLVLDFANIVHPSGARSPIFVRVALVDNAREVVRRNEIIGITQPHASTKAALGMRLAGMTNPAVAWTIEGLRAAYGLSLRREITYGKGSDFVLQVTGPSKLVEKTDWPGWARLPVDAELEKLVQRSPRRTTTPKGEMSDLTNLMFLGSQEQLERAFETAGWVDAHRLNVVSAMRTFEATVRKSGYEQAPMSVLMIEGKAPDFTFQKGLNTFAKRHHLRIWKQPGQYRGRDIWVSSSTHDTGIGVEKAKKWFHRIDPRIDRERAKVQDDLLFSSGATSYALVERPKGLRSAENATGDKLFTDGQMLVLWLAEAATVASR